ncbi:MAG: transcription factor S [Candidatus Woesearchaeota archaeon]
MLFCPKCGTILKPKDKSGKKMLWCSCGFTTELKKEELKEETRVEKPKEEVKRIHIVEEVETHPKIKATCEKCDNKEAYYWTQQTRGADEPETRFFKCTKCKHTWREYA